MAQPPLTDTAPVEPIAGAVSGARSPLADSDTRPYPENLMAFAVKGPTEERFARAREDYLLDYGYNTARAYWADLDDIYLWCRSRGIDVLAMTKTELSEYLRELGSRGYSPNTLRRRRTALRGLRRSVDALRSRCHNAG